MAEEDVKQLLPSAVEQFGQLVCIPENKSDGDLELLLTTARTSERLARTFAPTFGGTDSTFSAGDFGVITVEVRVKQLG
jgi:hypothetical protein